MTTTTEPAGVALLTQAERDVLYTDPERRAQRFVAWAQELAFIRSEVESYKRQVARLEADTKAQHAELYALSGTASARLKNFEEKLRWEITVAGSVADDKLKELAPGIGLRPEIDLDYDPEAVIEWAKVHMPTVTRTVLRVAEFEAWAKKAEDLPDCVHRTRLRKPTVAQNLPEVLRKAGHEVGLPWLDGGDAIAQPAQQPDDAEEADIAAAQSAGEQAAEAYERHQHDQHREDR